MKKTTVIIICLIAALVWREHVNARKQKQLVAFYEDKIEQTIQDVSDDLLDICEAKIEEILEQF